jgi:hypothetical protein
MPEQVTQIVKASVLDQDDQNEYRIVGMVDDLGFYASIETRANENAEWETEPHHNQYQLWEMDTPDFMKPVDLLTDEHLRDWFSGQGYEIEKPCECEEIRSINVGFVPSTECFGCHDNE